jgi:hypothetical protein
MGIGIELLLTQQRLRDYFECDITLIFDEDRIRLREATEVNFFSWGQRSFYL